MKERNERERKFSKQVNAANVVV